MGPKLATIHKPEPDQEVIAQLETALESARAGRIFGILLLEQDAGGVTYGCAGLKNRFEVIGFMSHAIHKLQTDD